MISGARVIGGLICAVLAMYCQAEAKGITLVDGGKSEYRIVVSTDASQSEKHAAKELSKFIRDISGASLPITTDDTGMRGPMILLGDGATLQSFGAGIDLNGLGDDGFVIKTVGRDLVIAGSRLRGTLNGVYGFLEDVLGCRWYTAYVSHIPKKRTIRLGTLDIVQKPSFERRHALYEVASANPEWAARNRENGSAKDEAYGRYMKYGGPRFVHTFYDIIPPETYAGTHPEYFALNNSVRTTSSSQLCLTNPDVLRIAKQTVLQWIKDNPDAKIFSVSQNDSVAGNCQCAQCLAIDAKEGSAAGAMLRFVNAIADEVALTHPDVLIDTLAYHYTEQPPLITRPRLNVIVRLCPINQCQYHPYEQCVKNAEFVDRLRGWCKICDRVYIWHYGTDFSAFMAPYPDLNQLATSIALYKRVGVKGIMVQGPVPWAGYGANGSGAFMDDLKAYLIAKLMWNADVSVSAIRADFLSGFLGNAGVPIGKFLELLQNRVETQNIHGRTYEGVGAPTAITGTSLSYRQAYMPSWTWGLCENLVLTPDIIRESDRLFDKAERVAGSSEVLARVRHMRLWLEFVKVMRETDKGSLGDAGQKARALKHLESFVKRCEAEGVTSLWGNPIRTDFDRLAAILR